MSPRSPIGLHSIVGAKPDLHLQVNAPGLFMHSVEAKSHWLDAHSFISEEKNEQIKELPTQDNEASDLTFASRNIVEVLIWPTLYDVGPR